MLGNLGITLQRGQRYLEAHDIFESLIKAEKNNPLWHWQLAFNYASQSKFGEAVTVYREIIRLRETGFNVPEMEAELGRRVIGQGEALEAVSDAGVLETAVDEVIAAHPENVEQYRAGEKKVVNFLMGQVMRRTQGKADPAAVRAILLRRLGE